MQLIAAALIGKIAAASIRIKGAKGVSTLPGKRFPRFPPNFMQTFSRRGYKCAFSGDNSSENVFPRIVTRKAFSLVARKSVYFRAILALKTFSP